MRADQDKVRESRIERDNSEVFRKWKTEGNKNHCRAGQDDNGTKHRREKREERRTVNYNRNEVTKTS